MFFEVSAKKFGEINNCFQQMVKKIYEIKKDFYKTSGSVNESFVVKDSVVQGEENSNYVCC